MSSVSSSSDWYPGQIFPIEGERVGLEGRSTVKLIIKNTGDRPVQVGSHFHFFECNKYLDFDRKSAYGMRLAIAAGTAVRFEPGQGHEVELIALGGERVVYGLNGLVSGKLDDEPTREKAMTLAKEKGFLGA